MIELIIFEQDEFLKNRIKNTIYKFFGSKEDDFKIINYNQARKNQHQKVYILSSDNFNDVIEIAKLIRNNNDFNSIIIILSYIKKEELNNDLLVLSYINYDHNMFSKLEKALNKAYNILIENNTFNFIHDRTIYRIPLNDILYIEKENNSNKCILHTKSKVYYINYSIKRFEKSVSCLKFMKVHRSCIVNLDNVIKYNIINNTLYFENGKTNLITREKRTLLKENLLSLTKKD